PPDVRVGGVCLLLAVAVGQVPLVEPGAHLVPTAELGDEVRVEPGLVDPQPRVGDESVAVEPLDVVALERRPVTPDVDPVILHRAHEEGAGDGPAQGSGVEVRPAGRADVEGAAGDGAQALLDERPGAVHQPRLLGAVLERTVGHLLDLRLVVLAEVGGVGEGDRPLLTHPGDGDRGVEATGEGDADAFAGGQGGQDFGHERKYMQNSASLCKPIIVRVLTVLEPPDSRPRPHIYGHRGAPGHVPQNTLGSYALAASMGVDAIEFDLVCTRDGALVDRHEPNLTGSTDIAHRTEFADRWREVTLGEITEQGGITTDLDLAELRTLRAPDRYPTLRPHTLEVDGDWGIPTLEEILELRSRVSAERGWELGVGIEIKHACLWHAMGFDPEQHVLEALAGAGLAAESPL